MKGHLSVVAVEGCVVSTTLDPYTYLLIALQHSTSYWVLKILSCTAFSSSSQTGNPDGTFPRERCLDTPGLAPPNVEG